MPTFERCPTSIDLLARELTGQYHKPLQDCKVKIDFVFAYPDYNEKTGAPTNDALSKNGIKALGMARVISLKDRALDRGDAEISLDGEWWKTASDSERAALLDHELEHVMVATDKHGNVQFDDLNRPKIRMRKHTIDVGWFANVAQRHGSASMERIQAKAIMDQLGQYFWADIAPTVTISPMGGALQSQSVTMPIGRFGEIAKDVANQTVA